jgi:phospholipid/cholesterol/gamma-HCH transport system ATP-binding protein
MNAKRSAGDRPAPEPGTKPQWAVEILIEGLYKAFDGKPVLKGVDLTVRRGDVLAVVGGSGCGKTVLINHVLGQLTPDKGRVLVTDHGLPGRPLVDLADIDLDRLDRIHMHWGVVFQRNALFSGTVFDNIALWLREVKNMDDAAIGEVARRVLKAVDLPADDEFLAQATEGLSGGMAKRLAVARALSMDPATLFYDEPTTGLDPTSSAHVHDLIAATHDEPRPGRPPRTTIIITHDKDLLQRLKPRVVLLNEGRVFFDGSLAEFEASSSPVIRPYFELMPSLHRRPMPIVAA